jgi:hypothetical protein
MNKEIKWYRFSQIFPKDYRYLVVEDHEGNMALGFWWEGWLELLSKNPLGMIVRWTDVDVRLESFGPDGLTSLYFNNGELILSDEFMCEDSIFNQEA